MKISFSINYHTKWGESLFICGDILALGGGDPNQAVEMKYSSPGVWTKDIQLENYPGNFSYFFIVKSDDKEWRFEWGKPHVFIGGKGLSDIKIFDSWQDMPPDKPYYSSAFVNGILMRRYRDLPLPSLPGTIQFRVNAPMVKPDEVLAIAGEGDFLGNWAPEKALHFNDSAYPEWKINLPLSDFKKPFEYKFLIVRKSTGEAVCWEKGDNRRFGFVDEDPECQIVIDGLRFENPRDNWKGAGTAIPVFSIRTEEDFGVGDFFDIKKMVDWCEITGQSVLQVLPINDTIKTGTWLDSYPYSANSAFALHPMYLRLEEVGILQNVARREHFRNAAKELNALPTVDYVAVNRLKDEYLRELFLIRGNKDLESDDFLRFYSKNEGWLKPYAAWKVMCEIFGTPDHNKWKEYAVYDQGKVDAFCLENPEAVRYQYFLQYHLDRQLSQARDYAHYHGVVLKGDIPIGIGRFSVDAWQHPRLFNMDCQAGAPPDDFSILGQNWGFPTYNWEEMATDGFQWWKDRFGKMAEYFDAYRIDHILGFFRIWEIPLDAIHGLLGYFNPALPFSSEELHLNFDFDINPEIQTKPLLLEDMLEDFFGEFADEVKQTYLESLSNGRYRLAHFVDTQRKLTDYFAHVEFSDKNHRIYNALMSVLDDVLFIEDPHKKGLYHPRICAYRTAQFRVLSDYGKQCFNRLYHDFFYVRNNDFWQEKAMMKLPPLIESTGMLTCAEDLGMIPACVPEVMKKLEILSLEIQRMPKDPECEFGEPWHYPYFSVCTTSSHDMGGIRSWWEMNPATTQRFFNSTLHQDDKAPDIAEPWICSKIIEQHLKSPSMFCILPLADWLSTDGTLRRENADEEQINEPSNSENYWHYRMHLTVEDLLKATDFNKSLHKNIKEANR